MSYSNSMFRCTQGKFSVLAVAALVFFVTTGLARAQAPWVQEAELLASDGVDNDRFGATAVSGGTLVAGASNHAVGSNLSQGAAYVFVQAGNGTWSQQAELIGSDSGGNDFFGWSVAVSGTTVVVGAPCHPLSASGQICGAGAAYVFSQNGDGTWSQQAELTASDGVGADWFGGSVTITGSTVVVGADCHPSSYPNCGPGAAYVFIEKGGTWVMQGELTASDGAAGDAFGASVAANGGTAVIGAGSHNVGSNQAQGAAYFFVQNGNGTWSQQAELTSSNGTAAGHFGGYVAVDGGTIVVGAPSQTVGSNQGQGAAYVFGQGAEGTWNQQAELTGSDGMSVDRFGDSVALSGSMVVAGAYCHPYDNDTLSCGPGAAYVFVGNSDGTWNQQAELTSSDGAAGDGFGSVAISGSTVFVGAGLQPCCPGSGAAYVFASSSAPSYALSASPSSLMVTPSLGGTSTINIAPYNGFAGTVTLSAAGLPKGVTAAFSPNPATSSSTLTVTASESFNSATLAVTGTSVDAAQTMTLGLWAVPQTFAPVSRAWMNFGNEVVGNTTAAKTVTLANRGPYPLYIKNIIATAGFLISANACLGGQLPVNRACAVSVSFTPTQPGSISGTLTFVDSAYNAPQIVALSGKGIAAATLAPANAIYAALKVGKTSAAKAFTLTNNQPVALTGIAISTTGDFAVSATTCGTSLVAKGKCTVSVTFTPAATGTRTGQLSVSDSATSGPQISNLTGTGK